MPERGQLFGWGQQAMRGPTAFSAALPYGLVSLDPPGWMPCCVV